MAYTPTAWINNQAPALSAANLNKLTDQIETLAAAGSVPHSLPAWANGVSPALTDAAPWNEIERVVGVLSSQAGFSFSPVTWQGGWTPARNAARLNRLELQVEALSTGAPVVTTPWSGYRYSIAPSIDQATNPNLPEIAYQADGSVTLTCFPNTTFFDVPPTRQLVSVYTFAAEAAAGRRVRYETRMTFPADFRGTTGEVNWWFEWHTTQGDGASQLSCTIGGRCDYPINQDIPGENLTWFFRPTGPGGTPPFNEMVGPAIPQGVQNVYDVRVEILWANPNGVFAVWLNGVQQRNWNMPTLWSGDVPALGVYNYRLKVPFTSSLNYTKPVITVL